MEIFAAITLIALIGIAVMIGRGVGRVRRGDMVASTDGSHPVGKHVHHVTKKTSVIFMYILHSFAIILSRLWAHISHRVSRWYQKIVRRLEDYFKHKHEHNVNKDVKTGSILLTTIKAYKREIKKLNQRIDPDPIEKDEAPKSE